MSSSFILSTIIHTLFLQTHLLRYPTHLLFALFEDIKTPIFDGQRPFHIVQPDIWNDIIYDISQLFLKILHPPNLATMEGSRTIAAQTCHDTFCL